MKILAVGAHLDDIELACGGTLAKAVANGHEVKAVVLSKSGYRNTNGIIQRTDEDAIREGSAALHEIGISDIEILDFLNKDIRFCSETVMAIDKVIENFSPDYIFCHHPFDTHQSHEGAAKATIAAARRSNSILFFEPLAPSGRSYVAFRPQLYVDITDSVERKIAALKKHVTEYNKFGRENWVNGVRARAGFRGYEMGSKYAEAFEILRMEMNFGKERVF